MKTLNLLILLNILGACTGSQNSKTAATAAPTNSAAMAAPAALAAPAVDGSNARKFFEMVGQIEGKPVSGFETYIPKTDSITIPEHVGLEDLREFTESYLKMHNLVLLKRENRLIISDMKEYDSLWLHGLVEGEQLASTSGKPLLVKLEATWCGPCRLQDRSFHTEEIIRKELEKFVLVKLDVTTLTDGSIGGRELTAQEKVGLAFLEKHKLQEGLSMPTIVIIDQKKQVKIIKSYYRNPQRVRDDLQNALL